MKILLFLLLVSFSTFAAEYEADVRTINGQSYIRIQNNLHHNIYCYVTSYKGYHEFVVAAKSKSRPYKVGKGFSYQCNW